MRLQTALLARAKRVRLARTARGTPMAMIDRARDLLREALPGRRGGDGTHAPSS
jgi:hypothetical protein